MPAPNVNTDEKERIKQTILWQLHKGKENATKGLEIAHSLGHRDDRRVRMMIEELITGGTVILASEQGYYLPASDDEVSEYLSILRSRATKIYNRISHIEYATGRKGARPGQIGLL